MPLQVEASVSALYAERNTKALAMRTSSQVSIEVNVHSEARHRIMSADKLSKIVVNDLFFAFIHHNACNIAS